MKMEATRCIIHMKTIHVWKWMLHTTKNAESRNITLNGINHQTYGTSATRNIFNGMSLYVKWLSISNSPVILLFLPSTEQEHFRNPELTSLSALNMFPLFKMEQINRVKNKNPISVKTFFFFTEFQTSSTLLSHHEPLPSNSFTRAFSMENSANSERCSLAIALLW